MKIKKVRVVNMMYNKTALYFAPLRFIRQEWSVAPSIFNIKAQGLTHCLLWIKLGLDEVYQVGFNALIWQFLMAVLVKHIIIIFSLNSKKLECFKEKNYRK